LECGVCAVRMNWCKEWERERGRQMEEGESVCCEKIVMLPLYVKVTPEG